MMAEKILEAKFPDLDLRQGTGLRDLVIRPGATLLALVNKALVYYHSQRSISDVNDDTPTEIVDKILSNWFMERKAGKKSVVSARLYFATQKNVYVGTESFFSPDNKKKFYPVTSYTIPAASLTYDSFSGEYFYDIDLAADTEGPDYDLTSGSLLYFSNFDPYFLRGEINYLKEVSAVTETNSKFISRSKTAVSTRNLINVPSIQNRLAEDFDFVNNCTPVGFGEPEMFRDLVDIYNTTTSSSSSIHIGGKSDVYVKLGLQTSVLQFPANQDGDIFIPGAYYDLARSQYSGGSSEDTLLPVTTKAVTSITRSGTVATVTCPLHTAVTGDTVAISGATPAGYNGSIVVTGYTANTFTYTVSSSLSSTVTGTITANVPTKYTVSYPAHMVRSTTSIARVGRTVTVTLPNHGVMENQYVQITEAVPSTFNGWFKVATVAKDSFTVLNTALPNDTSTASSTGFPVLHSVDPRQDYGLSPRQVTKVSFGAEKAGLSASFSLNGFMGLSGIQEYLEEGGNRVLAADPLARHYDVYLLSINVVGYNGPAPSSAVCYDVSKAYVDSLEPGAPFIMADLIAKYNAAGVVTIKTPVTVNYRFISRFLAPEATGVITDTLDPQARTSVFIVESLTTTNQYL